jgi:hypothetical protein
VVPTTGLIVNLITKKTLSGREVVEGRRSRCMRSVEGVVRPREGCWGVRELRDALSVAVRRWSDRVRGPVDEVRVDGRGRGPRAIATVSRGRTT